MALLVALVPLSLLAATPFTDLTGGPHDANIDAIFDAGITKGCDPPTYVNYCPTANVTREEMVSFLARTAGLGGNAPVANAKAAANAANADALDGKRADELVRVARGTGYTSLPFASLNTATYTTLATATLTLPGPGLVLVTGAVRTISPASAPTYAYIETRLRDTGPGGEASPDLVTTVGTDAPYAYQIPASPTYVFAVGAAGPRSFVLKSKVLNTVNPGGGRAGDATITALYIPFGPTGGTTLQPTP